MKKILFMMISFCISSLVAKNFNNSRILNDPSHIGKNLAGSTFKDAIIQNSSFAFANLAGADFTPTPGQKTNIGNDVSFYCANLNGIKYDKTDPALVSLFNLQAAATQENFDQCKAIATYKGITLPYSQADLPAGEQS